MGGHDGEKWEFGQGLERWEDMIRDQWGPTGTVIQETRIMGLLCGVMCGFGGRERMDWDY